MASRATSDEFVIVTKDGAYFQGIVRGQIMTCRHMEDAVRFPTRWKALEQCAATHLFAGSRILVYNPPPPAQDSI